MKHRLYSSAGNCVGLATYLGYFEIDADNHVSRYLEIATGGTALRYSEESPADEYGQLPEGPVDDTEASKPEYGFFTPITAEAFEDVWRNTICQNNGV
jgi:hypothetical protein